MFDGKKDHRRVPPTGTRGTVVREEALAQVDRALDTRPPWKGCLGRLAAPNPNRLRTRDRNRTGKYVAALGPVPESRRTTVFELVATREQRLEREAALPSAK
jgi:hypothetical protein